MPTQNAQDVLSLWTEWKLKDEATVEMIKGARAQERALIKLEVGSTQAAQRISQNFAKIQLAAAKANIESRTSLIATTKASLDRLKADQVRLEEMAWKRDQARAKQAARAYDKAAKDGEKANQIVSTSSRRHREAAEAVERHGGAIRWLERRIASLGVAMGVAYAMNATKNLVVDLVEANKQLKEGQFSVGALLFTASRAGTLKETFVSVAEAMDRARGIYRDLEISAARSVGTTKEFLQTWTFIANPVMNARGGIEQINELTRLTVAAAKIFGDDINITAMSVNQMLRGQIDARDKLASALRLTSKEINQFKSDLPEALKQTISRLREFSSVSAASADTFTGKWNTFQDVIIQVKREIGDPLFKEIEKTLTNWIKYFAENRQEVMKLARSIGEDLVSVLKTTMDVLSALKMSIGPVTDALTLMASAAVISGIANLAISVGGLAAAFSNVGAAIKANPAVFAALTIAAGGFALKEFAWDRPNAKAAAAKKRAFEERMRGIALANTATPELEAKYKEAKDMFVSMYPKEAESRHNQLIEFNNTLVRKGGGIPTNAMDPTKSAWYMKEMIGGFKHYVGQNAGQNVRFVHEFEEGWKPESERHPSEWVPGTIYEDMENKLKLNEKDVIQDFRGSHFEIKVDARHQDPDRVAASIIKQVGKKAVTGLSQARSARGSMSLG